METIETKKYNIISQIITFNNERIISEVENFIRNISLQLNFNDLFRSIKKDLKVEEMMKEQHFKGINKQYFDSIVQDLDIQEPFSELIAMI
jgi:hypothetical protein